MTIETNSTCCYNLYMWS